MPPDAPLPQVSPDAGPTPWYRKPRGQNLLLVLGAILALYGMIYWDVTSRAKEAYLEGEKYWRWYEHPEEKAAELARKYEAEKAKLAQELSRKKISQDQYDRRLETLDYEHRWQMEESAIKYAYVWYQTAYELFSPPESKWVKLSREKAPLAKERWKEELRAKNVKFEDYMLE